MTIIIPTMNEIDGMKWFMPRLKKEWYDELIIIDGNSSDGTVEYCREHNYPIFFQKGKGGSRAFDDAYKLSTQDIIVSVTPDGNSIPEAIPLLVEKIRQGYDMVIASRYLKPARSLDDSIFTAIGNKIFTFLINFLFRARYTDTLVGFRAFSRDALERMCLYKQDKQGWLKSRFLEMNSWDPASSIRALKLKLKVCEIPSDEPKRIGGVRKPSNIINGLGVLFQIMHEFMLGLNFSKYHFD